MWNYTTFKIGLIGIIWKKMELFGKKWNYLELFVNYLELLLELLELLLELLELFGITFGITLINLTVIPNGITWNYLELFGITFGITWNYLENNSIFGITRHFFLVSCPSL
jgi:hypothetical protein